MTHKKIQYFIVFLLSLIGFFILFWQYTILHQNKNITIAVALQPVFAHVFVAEEKGYFKDEGINVSFIKHELGKDALQEVHKGRASLATVFETPVVRAIYEGKDVSIISTLHRSSSNSAIITTKNSGIKSEKDLSGKRIGAARGTSNEYLVYSVMQAEGIQSTNITIIDLSGDAAISALKDGSIDAASLSSPYVRRAQRQLADQYVRINSDVYSEVSLLVSTKEYASSHEDELTQILRALIKADEFIYNNTDEAISIVKKWVPNTEEEDIRNEWNAIRFGLRLDNRLLSLLTREADFFKNTGVYSSDIPHFREFIYPSYLRKIRPDFVTVY